jgi:hypothetical protein
VIPRIPLVFAALIYCSTLVGAELIPFIKNNKVGMTLHEMKFPGGLAKDLTSGLSNRLLIRFELTQEPRVYSQIAEVTIKYDLWDENFRARTLINGIESATKTIPSLKEMLAFLGSLKATNLWPVAELPKGVLYAKAETLLNPIEKEQMEKIRTWVAQNSTSSLLDPTGFGTAKAVAPSRTNTLFNRIFEQYATGANVASVWHETVSAKPFQLSELVDEK